MVMVMGMQMVQLLLQSLGTSCLSYGSVFMFSRYALFFNCCCSFHVNMILLANENN
jgi:hypothetical protein